MGDGGIAHQPLPFLSNDDGLRLPVCQLFLGLEMGLDHFTAPEMPGVPDLGLPDLNPGINRFTAWPSTIMASNPAFLSFAPQNPLASDSP